MSRMKRILITLAATLGLVAPAALPVTVFAQGNDVQKGLCSGAELRIGGDCTASVANSDDDVNAFIETAINLFSLIVGIIAVVMIIVGGLKYITSGGDSGNVTGAKNTILYAVVGLIIVVLAQVIVRFVINQTNDLAT
jgi:hypothetical protein